MQPKLKVEYVNADALLPYAGNAKEHPEWQIEHIANSIEQFGFSDPIGVWTNADGVLEIVEGHGRLLAAKRLGIERVPIVKLDHMDDDARRAYAHVHNQTTLTSGFDEEALTLELESIPGFDWNDFGFGISEPYQQKDLEEIIEPEIPEIDEPKAKRGDIWTLGYHRLMCGDSTSGSDLEKLMVCEYANLLLTDPPYNVDYHGTSGSIKNDNFKSEDAFKDFLTDAFKSASSKMMPGAAFYVWFASVHSPAVYTAIQEGGLLPKQELEWVKSQFTLGRQDYQWAHEPCVYGWKDGAAHYFAPLRNEWSVIDDAMNTRKMTKTQLREALENILTNGIETTVLRYAKPASSELHPTTKPVKLFARLIQNSSRENEIVLDIFGGSGTTMMAAEQLHRRAFLMELDPHYCDVIIKRWESLTGMKAEKAS